MCIIALHGVLGRLLAVILISTTNTWYSLIFCTQIDNYFVTVSNKLFELSNWILRQQGWAYKHINIVACFVYLPEQHLNE